MREDVRALLRATVLHLVVSALFPCILSIRIKRKRSLSTADESSDRPSKKRVFKTTAVRREGETRLYEEREGQEMALQREETPEKLAKVRRNYALVLQTQESLRQKLLSFEDVRLK